MSPSVLRHHSLARITITVSLTSIIALRLPQCSKAIFAKPFHSSSATSVFLVLDGTHLNQQKRFRCCNLQVMYLQYINICCSHILQDKMTMCGALMHQPMDATKICGKLSITIGCMLISGHNS